MFGVSETNFVLLEQGTAPNAQLKVVESLLFTIIFNPFQIIEEEDLQVVKDRGTG